MLKRLQKATKDLFSNLCCDSGNGSFRNHVFFILCPETTKRAAAACYTLSRGAVLSSSVCAEHDASCEAVDEKVII